MSELFAPTFNLVVLLGLLFYYLRDPIRTAVRIRHETLRDELTKVRETLVQAQNQHEEFSAKLKAIDVEIAAHRNQLLQDAQAAKQRIIADAQRLSGNIATDARRAAEALYAELKGSLYADAGRSVLDRAEAILRDRLTGDDRARIRKEFSTQVETAQ